MSGVLPAGFEALESWVTEWAQPTENRRYDKRLRSTKEDLQGFYAALQPELVRILDYCDRYPIGELPEDAARLYDLAMMLAEIAPNVELYKGQPGVPHAFDERRFIARHGNQMH